MPRAGYAWSASLAALFVLAVIRSSDAATRAGQLGAIVGGILGPLLLAAIIWLVVQLVRRRRPAGFPAWIGAAAVAVGLATTLAELGNRAIEDEPARAAAALPACEPEAERYGTAPRGFEYTALSGADARDLLEDIQLGDPSLDSHVVVGRGRGDDDVVILVSIKRHGPQDDLDDYVSGVESTDRPVRRAQVGGREAAIVDNRDGSHIAAAVKGCHFLLVIGVGEKLVLRVAPAVFAA